MKKLFILTICLLLTGCTVKYNVNIDDKLEVTESATISGGEELYNSYFKTSRNNVLKSILDNYADNLKLSNYEYELIKGEDPYVNIKRKYNNLGDYLDSSKLFNGFFDKINYQNEGNIIKIETENFNPPEKDNQSRFYAEKVDIAIKSAYKVINHNASEVDERNNVYHYIIDENTKDFKIILEIDTASKFNPYLNSIITIIVVLLAIIAVWGIIIVINKKKKR